MSTRPRILGTLLVQTEAVDPTALELALGPEHRQGERVGQTLVRLGATTPDAVARALATQLGLECAASPLTPDAEALDAVRPTLSHAHSVLPLSIGARCIRLAMADPLDLRAIDDVQFQTGRRVDPVVTTPEAIDRAVESYLAVRADNGDQADPGSASPQHAIDRESTSSPGSEPSPTHGEFSDLVRALPSDLQSHGTSGVRDTSDLERETQRAPVVRLVDRILRRAIEDGASDIHVEETGSDVRVRLRIDGVLRQTVDLPAGARRAILSRIKVVAGMDISVRRRPQDGRVAFSHGRKKLTLRVSTLPVNGGEKAVVRILDSDSAPRDLGGLGMDSADLLQLRGLLGQGEGVILASGPTGSGKSTTLFAALSEIDRDTRNVVTVEDPVEYRLMGASQVQVDRRAGLSFADALRSILRQDPDVVMIGEIRDRETAEIAMAAAVTGHLVLSSIHTTDAPGAITRLLHMGVPPFLVAGGLAGVVAQRLVRKTCSACRGRGCEACDDGLRGRTGVYQTLAVTDPMRDEISGARSSARLRRLAMEAGMKTLESDARRAVAADLTTPHEIGRLLQAGSAATRPCRECGVPVPHGARGCPGCGRRRVRHCSCGEALERRWRYCPACIRPVSGG